MGYLLEELRDASNFKALQADVASANIFIGSLIFIEELADKVGRIACPRACGLRLHAGRTTCAWLGCKPGSLPAEMQKFVPVSR